MGDTGTCTMGLCATEEVRDETNKKPVKYSYFPLRARGFAPLLALEVGNVPYEAEVIQFKDWKPIKESGRCPFGYLSLLTLPDGTAINETTAVLNTIGYLGKLLGETLSDSAVSQMI